MSDDHHHNSVHDHPHEHHDHDHERGHGHSHGHGHGHHHHHIPQDMAVGKLIGAVGLNLVIVAAQVVAGVLSGSLALLADALHNFSDAASAVIALIARVVARKRADHRRTFGYRRAEIIGAMINLTALIILGLFLIGEAVSRFFEPHAVGGWAMVIVAAVAVAFNSLIAVLLAAGSKESMNIRAAFVHAMADVLASVGVIVAGVLIITLDWWWVDPLATLLIAAYVLYEGATMIRGAIHILLESVPEGLSIEQVVHEAESVDAVRGVHHLHVWQLDEHQRVLEAHVLISPTDAPQLETIKDAVKRRLAEKFEIHHATLEFELDEPGSALPRGDHTTLVPDH